MIRRTAGADWLLIAQAEHARIAGLLASHIGNQLFDRPGERELFVEAVTVHDDGWVNADAAPLVNGRGEPLDFTEASLAVSLNMWTASAERAAAMHPLIGLLVSLHSLSLSIDRSADNDAVADASARFALNKFQHRQIELQELCRKKLGLPADQPLHHGLAELSSDPREQAIVHQFRLLQAMDHLSLSLCCTHPIGMQVKGVVARPGGRPITLHLRRTSAATLTVKPWPMDLSPVLCSITAKRILAMPFSDGSLLAGAMESATPALIEFTVSASR